MPALGPFAAHAATYLRCGFSPIPIRRKSKAPLISEWSRWCTELPPPELVREWMRRYPDAGIAIACGRASGICALDLDHDDGTHAAILDAAGPSAVGRRGARGAAYFYRYDGQKSQAFRRNGETVCEILSDKRLVIVPATVHPDTGRPYEWITPGRLINFDSSQLPALNAVAIAALFDEPARQPELLRPATPRPAARSDDADAQLIAEALRHIPADDYHTWIQIGMALKSRLGDAGYQLWDDWSSASPKYDARQMQSRWDSFEPTRISAGTIFHLAGRHGWQRPRVQRHQR